MDGAEIFRAALAKIANGGADGGAGFEARVAEIAKRDNIPSFQAMTVARHEYPADFAAYQGDAMPTVAKAVPADRPGATATIPAAFVAKAQAVADAERIPLHMAMAKVRRDHSELLAS